jgi:iron(III) transport system ATP-binding protein
VTHDQEEALAISDRIAVMKSGVIQQVDSPESIYSRPFNVFVSTFIGHSNLLHALADKDEKGMYVEFRDGTRTYMDNLAEVAPGTPVTAGIRPEEFSLSDTGMKASIKNRTFLGRYIVYELDFEEGMILDEQASIEFSQDLGQAEKLFDVGDTITLMPNRRKINIFTEDGEKSLIKDVRWNG